MKSITSTQNKTIKDLLLLQEKSKIRNKAKLFIVEGLREIEMALASNFELVQIFINQNLENGYTFIKEFKINEEFVTFVSQDVYQKIAYRENTEGVVGLFKQKNHALENLILPENPLILVVENIEKPGNIGAMLRTADAANIDAFIIANPVTDLYNPNVIRSSLGGIFTNQIAVGTSQEVKDFLINKGIKIFSATLQNSNEYTNESYLCSSAIVVGSEANGVSEIWRKNTQNINIPMQGKLDSMNVSVAAAILIFEAKRQRLIK